MTLQEATNELLKINIALKKEVPLLEKLEYEYYSNYNHKLLNSGMGTIGLKEAEAKETLRLEPIFEKYHEQKLKVRLILTEKEILFEVSKNLRSLYHE